ncbi:carbohydrate kinase family protein [Chitinophaga oryzae]|uniref:Carbohydrate kinase family protein n=1 Tax=Chitinophaga oryzae TaxID=2725414 RepID=A0AAE7D6E9_9BACT|nr:carbohydrate kinase family protein [Chitinophaga oryzae]QJB30612.1 carbohydrate kinase family protein [Chitinophaga oryzae]QJB37112.1 carbohydrate kinase family protein [Chitinophaga oryzae]
MKNFDVLVAGELNVDLIFNRLSSLPSLGKEILAGEMTFTLGSSSAIFACNLSTLGASVAFAGKIGNDTFGRQLLHDLQQRNVDTRFITATAAAGTGISVALNDGQERAMITYPGAMNTFTAADVSDEMLRTARHLHVSSVFLQPGLAPGLATLFQRAKMQGLTTSLDPQWDPAEKWQLELPALLPYVDVFLPNIAELRAFTGETSVEACVQALSYHPGILAVKHGEAGAYIWDGYTLFHQPPFLHNEIADCIGAGDSFNAGFISRYLLGGNITQCAAFAALAGAVNTTAPGGITAFDTIDTFRAIASQKFNYQQPWT